MYKPSEDTFFLEDMIKCYKGRCALEIGIGSGYLTHILCKNFKLVVGTDISFNSLLFAKNNYLKNDNNAFLVCTDLALPLKNKFDLIISNPPYLPQGSVQFEDNTVHGGTKGFELGLKIIKSCLNLLNETGKLLIVRSNLSDLRRMDQMIQELSINSRVLARKRLFFEELEILELSEK
jgi:release factor glutamine methyltransferase